MKKSFVIKAPKMRLKKSVKIDYKVVFLFCLLICGVIIGTFIVKTSNEEFNSIVKTIISNNLSVKLKSNIFVVFSTFFATSLLFLIYNYIFGLCGFGGVFISLSSVLFGLYLGFSVSFYYITYSLDGIFYYMTVNLPVNAITAATLIKCCSNSYNMSNEIFMFVLKGKTGNKPLLKEYTLKYVIYIVPICVGSLISAILFRCLSHLFDFIS